MHSDPSPPAHSVGWTRAARLADGLPDEGIDRRRTRALIWVGVLVLASWAAGVALAMVLPAPRHGDADSTIRMILQLTLLVIGAVVGGVGFTWAFRTGHYITRWKSISSPLSPEERRSVRRQIAGRERLDEEHAALVVAIAAQGRRSTLGMVPIYSAMMLFAAATAVSTDVLVLRLMEVVASTGIAVSFVLLAVQYRRSGRFLAEQEHS